MLIILSGSTSYPTWGFYGHRLINKMAVFTLPQELLGFYKENIVYISDHAVDPDKRRYALKNESFRHYIDIDHWDTIPFPSVPRQLKKAKLEHAEVYCLDKNNIEKDITDHINDIDSFYYKFIHLDRFSPIVEIVDTSNLSMLIDRVYLNRCTKIIYRDTFVEKGVLPYFLEGY